MTASRPGFRIPFERVPEPESEQIQHPTLIALAWNSPTFRSGMKMHWHGKSMAHSVNTVSEQVNAAMAAMGMFDVCNIKG